MLPPTGTFESDARNGDAGNEYEDAEQVPEQHVVHARMLSRWGSPRPTLSAD